MFRRKKVLALILITLLLVSTIAGCKQEQEVMKESEITVNIAEAKTMDIAKTVKLSGVLKGIEEVYVIPKIPARVTAVLVKPGQTVSQGETIAILDASDFSAGLEQGQAALRLAQIQLENAAINLERSQKLHEAGALSTQQLEAAQVGYDSAEAGVAQASAALQMAQNQINNTIITSPINGVVGSVDISVGDMANPSAPVAVISNTSQLEIEVLASETEINYIKTGNEATVYIKSISEEPFTGKIDTVSLVPDPMKKNYVIKVTLPNKDGLIKSGMFAEVIIATETKTNVISVPTSALVPKGNKTVVYIVDKEKRAREKEVKVGLENSKNVEIEQGLKPGEIVITKGNTLVSEGTLVRVVTGGGK